MPVRREEDSELGIASSVKRETVERASEQDRIERTLVAGSRPKEDRFAGVHGQVRSRKTSICLARAPCPGRISRLDNARGNKRPANS